MDQRRGRKTSALIGVAFVIIVAGVSLLGFYGLRTSRQLGRVTRQSLHASTVALADQIVRKIEKRIIDQDRALFDLVDLKDLDDFKVFWDRLTTMSSLVIGALVLDKRYRIVHYASKEGPRQRRKFTTRFGRLILPVLELKDLALGHHKHLHTRIDGREVLISYMFVRQRGERFLVALNINVGHVTRVLLPQELKPLSLRYVTAVKDQRGRVLYGASPPRSLRRYQVTRRFPTTLYRWQVVLVPRAAASLAAQSERRERISILLVAASLGVMILGFWILIWGVRRERMLSQLKSDFVSTVTHELKTPLSLIRMYAELLVMDRPGAEKARGEYSAILTRETDRLSRLIDNVLDLARLEGGRPGVTPVRSNLTAIVRDAVALQQAGPSADKASVMVDVSEEDAEAEVDSEAVTVAVLNLLDNAVKYGAKTVQASVSADGRYWIIEVADDGPGVPQDEVDQLFERFFRGRVARTSRERGSGIGLNLVRLVAEAHHGDVAARAREGGGTVFSLRLPRASASPSGKASAGKSHHAER